MIRFPSEIAKIISEYCATYELVEWLHESDLDTCLKWANPHWLEKNSHLLSVVSKSELSMINMNPSHVAIEWLRNHPDNIDICLLCSNPHPWAMEKVRCNKNQIIWEDLARNESDIACDLLFEHFGPDLGMSKRNPCKDLFTNENPRIVEVIRKFAPSINKSSDLCYGKYPYAFDHLTSNSSDYAISIIKQYYACIDPYWLLSNKNPWAIDIIRRIITNDNVPNFEIFDLIPLEFMIPKIIKHIGCNPWIYQPKESKELFQALMNL